MNEVEKKVIDEVADDLAKFVEYEYSRRFRSLTPKEDRHLFFLAQIIARLKHLETEANEELTFGKVVPFSEFKRKKELLKTT